jgi:transcriptional regulator with XRE-family HTH domain
MASHQISQNARFLLWRQGVPTQEWTSWLCRVPNLSRPVISGLVSGELDDAAVSEEQLAAVAEGFGLGEVEELRYSDFAKERADVLQENLRYLFGSVEHGGKKALARALEIDPTTISRWLNGSYPPQGPTLGRLVSHFGLPEGTDLRKDPVFLSAEPLASLERRRLIRSAVDALSEREFRELYPALKRLLVNE